MLKEFLKSHVPDEWLASTTVQEQETMLCQLLGAFKGSGRVPSPTKFNPNFRGHNPGNKPQSRGLTQGTI